METLQNSLPFGDPLLPGFLVPIEIMHVNLDELLNGKTHAERWF